MKKKSNTQPPSKTPKNEKKQSIKSLIKFLRPKVYITDSSNFKNLVQELTGNGNHDSPVPSPPPSISIPLSPPTHDHHARRAYQENSVDFSTPLEGSPDLRVHQSHDDHGHLLLEDSLGSQNQGYPSLYADLEMLLMEMDSISSYDCDGWYDHAMNQQEVCVYDYELSTMI